MRRTVKSQKKQSLKKVAILGVPPQGVLLEMKVDLSSEMGIAYERSLHFYKPNHSHERVVICAARGATRAEIKDAISGNLFHNRADVIIFKPPNFLHSVKSLTTVYDDMALLPTVALIKEVGRLRGYTEDQLTQALSKCREVPRSLWLNQLIEKYFSLRIFAAAKEIRKPDLNFFEEQILVEILGMILGSAARNRTAAQISGELQRALEFIETHLFETLSLQQIAKTAGTSRSTLLRLFHEQLQVTPALYMRNRRLDEARFLIDKGETTVADVAELVGYQDTSAFNRAFRQRFGKSPRRDHLLTGKK